jgi:hypothetical protein
MAGLTELANHFGSDKGTVGPGPGFAGHNYTPVYEAYLGGYRERVFSLVEIGLGVKGDRWEAKIVQGRNTGGASVKMWREYFPRAYIYGLDVNECGYLDDERTRTFVADQGNVEDLAAFVEAVPSFDVVMDDGSHRPDHQQISLDFLFPRLSPGGLYFIEDLLDNGLGDGRAGRLASDRVLNTRRVLKHYLSTGALPEPHLLENFESWRGDIAGIEFHLRNKLCAIGKRQPVAGMTSM